MSIEANKQLASRYFNEVFNKGDFKALEEICARISSSRCRPTRSRTAASTATRGW